jgi:hypothetical protein
MTVIIVIYHLAQTYNSKSMDISFMNKELKYNYIIGTTLPTNKHM